MEIVKIYGGWFFDNDQKLSDYTTKQLDLLLYSPKVKPPNPSPNWHKNSEYIGLIPRITEGFIDVESTGYNKALEKISSTYVCPSCHGSRLNKDVLESKILNKSIADCSEMPLSELIQFIDCIEDDRISILLKDLQLKLHTLSTVGLDYLTKQSNRHIIWWGVPTNKNRKTFSKSVKRCIVCF